MLQKKGTEAVATLLPCLDPLLAQKKAADAELATQDIARRFAEDAMMLAKKRAMDATDAMLEQATRPVAAAAAAAPTAHKK